MSYGLWSGPVPVAVGRNGPRGIGTRRAGRPRAFALSRGCSLDQPLQRCGGGCAGALHFVLEAQHLSAVTGELTVQIPCPPPHHLLHPFLKCPITKGVIAEVGGRKEGDVWMDRRHPLVWWRCG